LFSSIGKCRSIEQVIEAIPRCYQSYIDVLDSDYFKERNLVRRDDGLGLIVQREHEAEWSGVLLVGPDGWLCEFDDGGLERSISGNMLPSSLKKSIGGVETVFLRERSHQAAVGLIERAVESIAPRIRQEFGTNCALEFGISAGRIALYQIRPVEHFHADALQSSPDNTTRAPSTIAIPGHELLGAKGAAARYFVDAGLFTRPILVFSPMEKLTTIEEMIDQTNFHADSLTVRFSRGLELGLPRKFVKTKAEAVAFVRERREPAWATIIHGYMNVQDSYELMLDKDAALLEHVPGLWESESRLPPDVIRLTEVEAKCWRVTNARLAKYEFSDGMKQVWVGAVQRDTLREWGTRLRTVCSILRRDYLAQLPLNFHFVEDEAGRWQFLNIRRGFPVAAEDTHCADPHVVSNLADLSKWDGNAPILLQVSTRRGSEKTLVELARQLRGVKSTIIADFGVLSHPAMVLKEYGVNVIPAYQSSARVRGTEYDAFAISLG